MSEIERANRMLRQRENHLMFAELVEAGWDHFRVEAFATRLLVNQWAVESLRERVEE